MRYYTKYFGIYYNSQKFLSFVPNLKQTPKFDMAGGQKARNEKPKSKIRF